MERHAGHPAVGIGFCTDIGKRQENQDFGAAMSGPAGHLARHGVVAAVADGVGGHKGGRVAAEAAVHALLDGYLGAPRTLGIQQACARAVEAVNRWISTQGRIDPDLEGMACTLTALVLKERRIHLIHIGDSRLYRLRDGRLLQLTTDHTHSHPDMRHVLHRAVGMEETVRIDYAAHPAAVHDRYLLCTDGIHGPLHDRQIGDILTRGAGPDETARLLVETALDRGGSDNATALVLDVLALPAASHEELESAGAALPVLPLPEPGDMVDGFLLGEPLADARYSRLFMATDPAEGSTLVLKFPKPVVGDETELRAAFVREGWIGAQLHSPGLGEVIELSPERQRRLYVVMPYYAGETLEQRLRRTPRMSLREGIGIGIRLARAVAVLHRAGVIHRDIKPDNIILTEQGARLLDFGIARLIHREEQDTGGEIPGTASYMAPEMYEGERGSERTDIFALGVTLYRMFSGGAYPYGEIEPFSRPQFGTPVPLLRHRPDLPAWLDAALARAIAVNPQDRFVDAVELAVTLDNASSRSAPPPKRHRSLYERDPLAFWQFLCFVLAASLLILAAQTVGP